MKNFISVLYIKPNSFSDEKICIGLFSSSDNGVAFKYSESKLKALTVSLYTEVIKSLKDDLKRIDAEVKDLNNSSNLISHESSYYNSGYFTYLSRYSSGLLHFTAPEPISNPVDKSLFITLFNKYVGEEEKVRHTKGNSEFKRNLKSILRKEVFTKHADINFELTTKLVPHIIVPTKIDFIACNGSILAGKAIDFNAETNTILNQINSFWTVSEGLKSLANQRKLKGEGTYEIFINEPESKEHKNIVTNLSKNPIIPFKVKDMGDLDQKSAVLPHYEKFSSRLGEGN